MYVKKDGTPKVRKTRAQRAADRVEHEKLLAIMIPELRLGPLSNEALQAVTGCMDGRKIAAALRRARTRGEIEPVYRSNGDDNWHTELYELSAKAHHQAAIASLRAA